ncbi:hypothetical protein NBT05_11975 [Aquimarina sp. ERC-38]|uniref:hypothetical protein n=1 Tax=Aquimarina sp. ERC-38 TaxID=2949996 RepID=UPI00224590B0|nr:hypothetical protein [Aquimarina sp. ERC-38]UZO79669.1 hypothetical protein NBT05_11975 [Aquimarina sp. ERC-38]
MILQAIVDQPNEGQLRKCWTSSEEKLHRDFEIHQFTIFYWMELDEHNFENCKHLSPLLETLYKQNSERVTTDNK